MPQRTPKPAAQKRKPAPRRAVTKADGKAVLVYFPEHVVDLVDGVVRQEDTDRSKWVRQACREALERRGVIVA